MLQMERSETKVQESPEAVYKEGANVLRSQYDLELGRYLQTSGEERQALMMTLLRLRWAAEEMERAGKRVGSTERV